MSGKKEVHTEWEEKVHPYHLPIHISTNLETVNEQLLKMNQILDEAGMDDTGYADQSSEIEMVADGIGKLNAYVGSLISTAGTKLDDPLYKAFDQGATENLSRIKMENYSTENTLGIQEHDILPEDDGIQQIGYDVLKDKLTLDDFLGLTGLKQGGTEGSVSHVPDEFKDFTDMFALDYNGIKAELIDSDGVQIGLEEYLKEISTLGEYDHKMNQSGLNFLSSLLDITIVKPLYEACTGYDIITGEDLSDMERGLKVIFAVIDVVTLGTGMAVTKLAGQGTKGALKFAAKTVAVDAVSFAVSYGVSEAGEALGLPLPLTLVLSLGGGVTMSRQLGKYVFKDSTGKVILESNADEVDAVLKGTGGAKSSKIYTPVEYEGTVKVNGEVRDVSRRVYQRNDIDFDLVDETTGLTNLERMQAGKPPIGSDGNPIQLHHVLQKEAGPMAEIREVTHQQYYSQLHGLVEDGGSFRNNPMLNKQYNNFRYNYWKWRASQIIGG